MSWQKPDSWRTAKLADICYRIVDGSHNPPTGQSSGKPMLSAKNIHSGKIYFDELRLLNNEDFELENKRTNISAGDVLLTIVGAIGRTAVVPEKHPEFTLQRSVAVLKPELINSKYLRYLLESPEVQVFFRVNAKGTAQKGIYLKTLGGMEISIAPLAEQTRIAQKLDELLVQVDILKARIDAIPALLKRFRQSVLAAAVSGRLTDEWRAVKQDPAVNLEILEDVLKIRRGVPENVKFPDELEKFDKPDSWILASTAQLIKKGVIVDLKDGNHGANHPKTADFTVDGLPFITAANVSDDGVIDYLSAPKVSGDALSKLRVGFSDPEDVIFTHKGTVGRVAINSQQCVLSPPTTYYRLNQNILSNDYLAIYLRSNKFSVQINAVKSQTTRDFVPITAQYELFHLIPPLAEQTEIVRRVEQLFAFADQLEAKVASAKTRIDHLTQSILAKAFRGELVPQDPNDEPASVLLERIKAQRAAAPKVKRGRKASA